MKYKIITEDTQEQLESAVNAFQKDVRQDLSRDINMLGAPFQVQEGPEVFRIAQAFWF